MKTLFLSVLFSFTIQLTNACNCEVKLQLTRTTLDNMQYIALVKAKQQLPFNYTQGSNAPLQYEVLIEELALFKGTSKQKIAVFGAAPDSKTIHTSCDIAVRPDEEWMIITSQMTDDMPQIGMCGYSRMYRSADGFRDLRNDNAFKQLDLIVSNLPGAKIPAELLDRDKPVLFYPDGKPERTIPYKGGKRNGTAIYYFPNGTVYGRIGYTKDSLNGKSIWYNEDGTVFSVESFRMGRHVDSAITYMPGGKLPFGITIYSKKGLKQKSFFYQGDNVIVPHHLASESLFKDGQRISTRNYRNGKLWIVEEFRPEGTLELQYNDSGKLIEQRQYDTHGKLLTRENVP